MTEVHLSYVIQSFWCRTKQDAIQSKFLVPEKYGTRMHDTRAQDSFGTRMFIKILKKISDSVAEL